jgi:hypothetical protein
MDIRPTLGGKNLLHDFSLPNRKRLSGHELNQFFKEIVKQISLKNIGRMSILQNSTLYYPVYSTVSYSVILRSYKCISL